MTSLNDEISDAMNVFTHKHGQKPNTLLVGHHAAKKRKSSRLKCHICGRWLNSQNRCAKLWSDGEGSWEHD